MFQLQRGKNGYRADGRHAQLKSSLLQVPAPLCSTLSDRAPLVVTKGP